MNTLDRDIMNTFLYKMKEKYKLYLILLFINVAIVNVVFAQDQPQPSFDLDTENAAAGIVIPAYAPVIFQAVSPSGGDATLVLRVTTLVANAWFDATAPYHETAVGVYSHLERRPAVEASNRNINIALLYASYHVLNSLLPEFSQNWRGMLTGVGLDPDDDSTDITTAIGLGNVAGRLVVEGRQNDGMNQLGNEGRDNNFMPYMDYTGFKPVNNAYRLRRPSKWQPDLQRLGLGIYKVQQFVTPQYALVEPYSYENPHHFYIPPPRNSRYKTRAYRLQAQEVLEASANLTEDQKLKSELYDNKIRSLGFFTGHAAFSRGMSLLEFIHFDFLVNMAAFDAGIFIWQEKRRYNAVRPFSAIKHLYKDRMVRAWGGPGKGTIDIKASEWKSYLEEADHPEYPSASSCFCAAHAQSARLYLGSDDLFYPAFFPAGSSRIEPGITPAEDTTLMINTWTDMANDCGQSRLWAGVHFQAAIDESTEFCPIFGDMAYEYISSLIDGAAELRSPSKGREY